MGFLPPPHPGCKSWCDYRGTSSIRNHLPRFLRARYPCTRTCWWYLHMAGVSFIHVASQFRMDLSEVPLSSEYGTYKTAKARFWPWLSGTSPQKHVSYSLYTRKRYRSISHQVFRKSFCKSQFPNRFVNLFFILVMIKDKLTDLCGNWLLHNDWINTFCEIKVFLARRQI